MNRQDIPCRVSADLRAYESANDLPEASAEDLRDARLELEEELAAGERIGKLDLEAILDEELDKNYAATLRRLYEHFAGIGGGDSSERCMDAGEWMLRLVRQSITEEMVDERAAKIRAERDADAKLWGDER